MRPRPHDGEGRRQVLVSARAGASIELTSAICGVVTRGPRPRSIGLHLSSDFDDDMQANTVEGSHRRRARR